MSAALLPPNPAETDIASGTSWQRTFPLSQSTLGLSIGSVSRSVGNSTPQRTAMIAMIAYFQAVGIGHLLATVIADGGAPSPRALSSSTRRAPEAARDHAQLPPRCVDACVWL